MESKPGNPTLEKARDKATGPQKEELVQLLEWSYAVNRAVEEIVEGVPPFPNARRFFESAGSMADLIVVSSTPEEALQREWEEHHIADMVAVIAGQETGKKADVLSDAKALGNYHWENVLMIGDAPGDYQAAQKAGCYFFPIMPGRENESWERLLTEAFPKLLDGNFSSDYANGLIEEFLAALPERPHWIKESAIP